LKQLREDGHDTAAEHFKARYTCRMYDLSEFVKTLKQRFSQSYNRRHGRRGTLWEERFKSIVIQSPCTDNQALWAVAAYIDLNAVRAGIVQDPKDHRFCGYGEAVGGSHLARQGIGSIFPDLDPSGRWRIVSKKYRKLLYVSGEAQGLSETGRPTRPGIDPPKVKAVLDTGGALPLNELLRCRVRYFTDGVVLGSRSYVDEVFGRYRERFGYKRKTGARSMKGIEGWRLCTARRLRLHVVSVPGC
jgi:hypothetical protein